MQINQPFPLGKEYLCWQGLQAPNLVYYYAPSGLTASLKM